ncbi:MAG TPA: uracil-DNA glycosylase [Clostridia bacterium]|nr:uracil-DNA glycosylase [Clostridia bacterium]
MAKTLDPLTRQAVADRLRYYRDLGIYDFYKRPPGEPSENAASSAVEVANPEAAGSEISPESAVNPMPVLDDRVSALHGIREDLGDCTRCVLHKQGRKQIVFGVGNPEAELMFVGEGPGADEDEQGEPFVGRAGQLLNNMIQAMGLRREDVYIANVVKCRPPQNRTPEREECDTCSPFLMRQIAVVQPKIIVALGAVAAKNLLGVNDSMANLRGRFYDFSPVLPKNAPERALDFEGTKLAVTYHPAYLLRDPRQKKETWKDLQMVMHYLGLPMPQKSSE